MNSSKIILILPFFWYLVLLFFPPQLPYSDYLTESPIPLLTTIIGFFAYTISILYAVAYLLRLTKFAIVSSETEMDSAQQPHLLQFVQTHIRALVMFTYIKAIQSLSFNLDSSAESTMFVFGFIFAFIPVLYWISGILVRFSRPADKPRISFQTGWLLLLLTTIYLLFKLSSQVWNAFKSIFNLLGFMAETSEVSSEILDSDLETFFMVFFLLLPVIVIALLVKVFLKLQQIKTELTRLIALTRRIKPALRAFRNRLKRD